MEKDIRTRGNGGHVWNVRSWRGRGEAPSAA